MMGCQFYDCKFNLSTEKFLVDLGFIKGECDSCKKHEKCMFQLIKTKEMEKKN